MFIAKKLKLNRDMTILLHFKSFITLFTVVYVYVYVSLLLSVPIFMLQDTCRMIVHLSENNSLHHEHPWSQTKVIRQS